MPKIMYYAGIFILVVLIILSLLCVIFLIYRKYRQVIIDKRSAEIVEHGGISELWEIELNGVRQYITIETKDPANPVLLFLYGGPGLAAPFGASSRGLYPEILEQVTAVYWDQRGAGKSLKNTKVSSLTIRQFVDDVLTLSEIIRKKFGQEKIFIFGVSWGTVPALRAVAERPELYHAYFSCGQVTNLILSEQVDYQRLLECAIKKDKEILQEIGSPPYANSADYNKFSAISDRTISKDLIKPNLLTLLSGVLYSPDYSMSDIYNTIFRAQSLNMKKSGLRSEMYTLDFCKEIIHVEIPVYIFNGRYDSTIPMKQTQEYFNRLSAPSKELICMEHSGHIPCTKDMDYAINFMLRKIF